MSVFIFLDTTVSCGVQRGTLVCYCVMMPGLFCCLLGASSRLVRCGYQRAGPKCVTHTQPPPLSLSLSLFYTNLAGNFTVGKKGKIQNAKKTGACSQGSTPRLTTSRIDCILHYANVQIREHAKFTLNLINQV